MIKKLYYSNVEYVDRFGKSNREFQVYCDPDRKPNIGDFLETFKKAGYDMELTDFSNLTFKPKDPVTTPVISLRIIRTYQAD
jgi:hypothetical protein